MHEQWLSTIDNYRDRPQPGESYRLWTLPPRDTRTGKVRVRADGDPYTPAWRPGDIVIVYHPQRDRTELILEITGLPRYDGRRELLWTQTRVLAAKVDGPTLAELGISQALQGGRHRIPARARRLAFDQFDLTGAAA